MLRVLGHCEWILWHLSSSERTKNMRHMFANDQRWQLAISTLAKDLHLRGDVVSYNSAIASCEWLAAWQLLAIHQDVKIQANVRSYGAAASSCRSQWIRAKFLLEMMATRHVVANLVIWNTCSGACKSAGQWLQAKLRQSKENQRF